MGLQEPSNLCVSVGDKNKCPMSRSLTLSTISFNGWTLSRNVMCDVVITSQEHTIKCKSVLRCNYILTQYSLPVPLSVGHYHVKYYCIVSKGYIILNKYY